MNVWQKIIVGVLSALAWGIAIYVGYLIPALAASMAEIKIAAQSVLAGLGVYHVGSIINAKPDNPGVITNRQVGFARVSMLLTLAAIMIAVSLTGCASFSSAVAGKMKVVEADARAANDNIVEGIKDATCALPYGTILRHPEIQPAAQSICGATANPAALLPAANVPGIKDPLLPFGAK